MVTLRLTIPVLVLAMSVGLGAFQAAVAVTYLAPASLTLHEPVIITAVIQNFLVEPVNIDLGWNRREGFVLTVRGPDGKVHHPSLAANGIGRVGRLSIAPNADYAQTLVLDDWFPFDQPGSYQVEIRLTAPLSGAGGAIPSPPPDVLHLEVGPRNETILRNTCLQLAPSVISPSAGEWYEALHVLGHMRDPVTIPCLRSVLDSTNRADMVIIEALRKMGTREARKALQEIAAGSTGDRAMGARSALLMLKQP